MLGYYYIYSRRLLAKMKNINFWLYTSMLMCMQLFSMCRCVQSADDTIDPACVKDATLPAKGDNYLDCQTDESIAEGRTKCCEVDSEKGCCKPDGRWTELIVICSCIAATTFILASCCFYWLWCDPESCPAIGRCKSKTRGSYERLEERCNCCRDRVEKRRRIEEDRKRIAGIEAPPADIPDDFQLELDSRKEAYLGMGFMDEGVACNKF